MEEDKVGDQEFRTKALWLRHNRNPEGTVLDYMRDLFVRRRKEVLSLSKGKVVASACPSIEANWPRLFDNVACVRVFHLLFDKN